MNRLSIQRALLAAVCGAVGAALNSLPVGAVAPLLPGRVFTLPIAILFGPWLGAWAAAIAAAGTGRALPSALP